MNMLPESKLNRTLITDDELLEIEGRDINTVFQYILFAIGILFLLFFMLLSICPPFLRTSTRFKKRAQDDQLPTGEIAEITEKI